MVGAGLRFFAVMDCPGKRGEVGLSLTVAIRITVTPSTSAELCRRKFFSDSAPVCLWQRAGAAIV